MYLNFLLLPKNTDGQWSEKLHRAHDQNPVARVFRLQNFPQRFQGNLNYHWFPHFLDLYPAFRCNSEMAHFPTNILLSHFLHQEEEFESISCVVSSASFSLSRGISTTSSFSSPFTLSTTCFHYLPDQVVLPQQTLFPHVYVCLIKWYFHRKFISSIFIYCFRTSRCFYWFNVISVSWRRRKIRCTLTCIFLNSLVWATVFRCLVFWSCTIFGWPTVASTGLSVSREEYVVSL